MTKGQKKGEPAPFMMFEMYEDQIVEGLADGLTQFQIAEKIPKVSEATVHKYVQKIITKHGARNTPNLIHILHRKGLLHH